MAILLIVEDDRKTNDAICEYLRPAGHKVIPAYDGVEALQLFRENSIDLVVLDIMLPGEDGFALLQKLRNQPQTHDIPVIIVTAKSTEVDAVRGLENGADDYITKPFGIIELVARVKVVLRRIQKPQPARLQAGQIVLDDDKRQVLANGKECSLTFKEYELLKLLLLNSGIVLSRERIMDKVWGTDFEGESRTVDMHIKTLRQKLGESGASIKTVRNVGYKIE